MAKKISLATHRSRYLARKRAEAAAILPAEDDEDYQPLIETKEEMAARIARFYEAEMEG